MKMKARMVSTACRLIAALVLMATTAGAQQDATAGAENAPADPIQAIIDQEVAPAPGQYTYRAEGRRDPFVSLLKPVTSARSADAARGIEGFLIQEVTLTGVVKTPDGYTAMLVGGDNKSYFVKVGQRLYDGAITAMDGHSLTFRQEVTDPLSPVRTRDVRKSLYENEEAPQ